MHQHISTLHEFLSEYWPHIVLTFSVLVSASAAVHAAMNKNDVRAAIGWVGVIIMSPLLGPLLYLIAGINRVRRSQIYEQRDKTFKQFISYPEPPVSDIESCAGIQFRSLHILGDRVSRFQLRSGNHVQLLAGGDQAYPAMLAAIRNAQSTIAMQSYIFDNDRIGRIFIEALAEAHARGVNIRVLIDAVGAKYSHPPITRLLRKHQIPHALFMTNPLGFMRMPYANLRSHRKLLIVDGIHAFAGGMNIREGFMTEFGKENTAKDTHFSIEGPAILQLFSSFAHDWEFTTKEELPYAEWCVKEWNPPHPHVPARCIRSGPDRFIGSNHHMLQGACAVATRHIRIQSPYFLPDQVLMGAINTAARRGVQVDIVIPKNNNLRLVGYAMMAQIDQLISAGCRVWMATGNFNHSKLATVDGQWSYVGSSNMDPRSLRLNFELDLEIYDTTITGQVSNLIDNEIETAEALTLEHLKNLPFHKRLRNRVIWLASPYL